MQLAHYGCIGGRMLAIIVQLGNYAFAALFLFLNQCRQMS